MHPTIEHFRPDDTFSAMAGALDRDGVVVIDHLFGPDVLGPVHDEIGPWLDKADKAGGAFLGHSTKAVPGLLAKSPAFADCVTDQLILRLADHVLLPNCKQYQLQISTAQEVWAGGAAQKPHRDEEVYGDVLPYGPEAPQYVLGVIVAGSDFTATNGATRIAPGSHRWPRERACTNDDLIPAVMATGSAVVYTGRTVHHAGVNETDTGRTAFIYGYSVGWLRQEENLLVECEREYAASLPRRAQQLIGYAAYSPIVGWAAERDPDLLTQPAPPGYTWPASDNVADLSVTP